MPKMFYETEEEAKKAAYKRAKKVFKFCDGMYFVGTYEQAIVRIMQKTVNQPQPYMRQRQKASGDEKNN